jgi:hypothetical protein
MSTLLGLLSLAGAGAAFGSGNYPAGKFSGHG